MSPDDNSQHTDRNVPTDPKGNLLKDLWDKSDAMGVAILEMLEEWAVRTNSPFVALWTHGVAPAHGKIYFDSIQGQRVRWRGLRRPAVRRERELRGESCSVGRGATCGAVYLRRERYSESRCVCHPA